MRRTLVPLCALALLATGGVTACGGPDQPDTVAQEFADAVNRDDVAAAAGLTSDPAAASATLSQMLDALGTEMTMTVASTNRDAETFTLGVDWQLDAGNRKWAYTTDGAATEAGDAWKITWSPSLLAPGLTADEKVALATLYPQPSARVTDRTGADLLTDQVVTLVNVDATADPGLVAPLLATVVPTITADSLSADLAAAGGQSVTAITLRQSDIDPIRPALAALPGVTLADQNRLLTADRALASPTWNDLATLWQQAHDASAGWVVQAVAPDGSARRLTGQDPVPASDITTTLDPALQRNAEAALAPLTQPATIVALQPSTGDVLAIAQNAAADAEGPSALTGLYPPGSTFKVVTTAAALASGQVNPDTVLPCPGSADIEGRTIPNDDNFDLGQVPLHTAFARSCNTTFGRLAVGMAPTALTDAAAQFGLGIDYTIPGLTTVTGSVPTADTPALRVEAGIGQGQVTASPFGMALVAATVAHGGVPTPTMVTGQPGIGDRQPPALPAGITDALRPMMRETVATGTAAALADVGDLIGKTGTAEAGEATHGWFVGVRGDLAFAVFVADAGTSQPAIDAAGRFIRAPRV
ncbi:MAG TPA: penicillin-binding transpeptidase domain-containing protein [Aldersonia sp.]